MLVNGDDDGKAMDDYDDTNYDDDSCYEGDGNGNTEDDDGGNVNTDSQEENEIEIMKI